MDTKQEEKPKLTKAEAHDLKVLSKEAHVPVAEIKKSPAADVKPEEPAKPEEPVKSEQEIANEEFTKKLNDLAGQVAKLATDSNQAERVKKAVHDALKAAHMSNYR